MSENRKPNWEKWRHFAEVNVIQVVALSLNIDPDKVKVSPLGWMNNTISFDESQEFANRIAVVRSNLGKHPALKLGTIIMGDPLHCGLSLARFHEFCKSVDWRLPPEFPQRGIADEVPVNRERWLAEDAWSEAELRDMLCGLEPNSARESADETNRAREAIGRAVIFGALVSTTPADASKADKLYDHHRFFALNDAIKWAVSKQQLFPKFPFVRSDIPNSGELGTRERDTLLKIIIAAVIDRLGYDPDQKKSPIPKELADTLESFGISLDVDTIRKKLKEAAVLLPADWKRK